MRVPEAGEAVPRRRGRLLAALGRLSLSALGWRIEGELPNVPKCVIIIAPHTSNWDFVLAMATILALGVRVDWLGKDRIFRGPFVPLLRWLGGIPIDRGAPEGVVDRTVELFRARDRLFLGLSPEGTRKRVERWKSGFYRIAHGAGVPIFPVSLDHSVRVVGLRPLFAPTGDLDADVDLLRSHFTRAMARRPESY